MKVTCQYFLKCKNDATCLVPHPVLEIVPSCDRCARITEYDPDKLARILEVTEDGEFIVDKDPLSTS
jgi:hypothetical protein